MARFPIGTFSHAKGNSTAGTIILVPPVAGQSVAIYRLLLSISSPAVTITIQDTSGVALSHILNFGEDSGGVLDESPAGDPWWTSGSGLGIQLEQSGTSNVGFDVWFLQRPG
jgi:hypothetical protein